MSWSFAASHSNTILTRNLAIASRSRVSCAHKVA